MRAVPRPLGLLAIAGLIAPVLAQEPPEAALKSKFSATFNETRLYTVVESLQKSTGANLVLRANPDLTVSEAFSNVPAAEALAEVLKKLGLQQTRWCGAIVIHEKDKGPGAEPTLPSSPALDAAVTNLTLESQPFLLALDRVREKTKLKIDLTPRARGHATSAVGTVTLRAFRLPAKCILTHVAAAAGLAWTAKDGTVVFDISGPGRTVDEGSLDVTRDLVQEGPQVDVAKAIGELKAPGTRESARRQLLIAGKRAAPELVKALKDADPATALALLDCLGQTGGPEHGDAVVAVFRDPSRSVDVRTAAGQTLGALKANAAVPALVEALDDPWFRVAEAARGSLVAIGEASIAPLLAKWEPAAAAANGKDGLVYRGLLIMGSVGGDKARTVLLNALKTKTGPRAVPLRHHAAIGLGFSGDTKVVEPLIQALDEEREFLVASYIGRSLGWITKAELPPQASRWRVWWANNKERLDPSLRERETYDPVKVPVGPDGLPLLDPPGEKKD